MPASRPVLVVARSSSSNELVEELGRLGWLPTCVEDLPAAAALLRTRRFKVALLVLQEHQPEAARHFEACLAAGADCEWVGVFPPGDSNRPPWRELILTHFFDHHTNPPDVAFLCRSLGHAWGRGALRAQRHAEHRSADDLGMVGLSPSLQRLRCDIRKAGPTGAPVLISGESGSGKELVARALHGSSKRASGPFVPVNCGALSPTLVHSELFGHEKGSFSGATSARRGLIEAASGGTLFLDEVAELPLETQATLLRFLQEGTILRVGASQHVTVDVRVIAASHTDLGAAAAEGRFRHDLYYRLNVLTLNVPPLRERKEDIPRLVRHVQERTAAAYPITARGFHPDATAAMLAHTWPGNVRELFNRVQRALVMCEHALVRPEDLGLVAPPLAIAENLQDARVEAEKIAIRTSLARVSHNVTLAARDLGVSRMTLYRLMAKYSISPRAA
jgi:two-component system, NtrC family, response regulator HydG